MAKGKLAEMFPAGSGDIMAGQNIYLDAAELAEKERRREEEKARARAESGQVKNTIDLGALKQLKSRYAIYKSPCLTIGKDYIRISSVAAQQFGENPKLAVLANEYFVAVKESPDGILGRHEKCGLRRSVYINRVDLVRQLIELGWRVGMQVELYWDDEKRFWWGRKPKGRD